MIDIGVEDRLLIHELSARYAFLVDTKRYAEASALFAEDGTWDETVLGAPRCDSREQIETFFPLMSSTDLEFMIHLNANHQISESAGDSAKGTVHVHVAGRMNGRDMTIYGYYDDAYTKKDGHWLFQSRRLVALTPPQGDFGVDAAAAAAG